MYPDNPFSNLDIPYNDKITGARGFKELCGPSTFTGSFYAFELSNGAIIQSLKYSDGNVETIDPSGSMFFESMSLGAMGSSPYFFPKGIYGTGMTTTSGQVKFWRI